MRLFFENLYENLNHLIAVGVVYILKTLYSFCSRKIYKKNKELE